MPDPDLIEAIQADLKAAGIKPIEALATALTRITDDDPLSGDPLDVLESLLDRISDEA